MKALPTFSMREEVFAYTQAVHNQVNRHPFILSIISRKSSPPAQLMRDYIQYQATFLGAIEGELAKRSVELKSSEEGERLLGFFEKLFRSQRCIESAKHMDDAFGTKPSDSMPAVLSDYIDHIQHLEDPRHVCVHAWINMTDALFGGTMLTSRLVEDFDEKTAAYLSTPELLDPSLKPLHAIKQARKIMAEQFQPNFDGLDWKEGDKSAVFVEATRAFNHAKSILDSLGYVKS